MNNNGHDIMAEPPDREKRVLMLAPTRRDAKLSAAILTEAGLNCLGCANVEELCRELEQGAGCLLIAETVLLTEGVAQLAESLQLQPGWSDLPVIVMTRGGVDEAPHLLSMVEVVSNVTMLEIPVRISTLLSTLQTALRARTRQYQIRDQLVQHQKDEKAVREITQRLELAVASGNLGIWDWNTESNIMTWDDRMYELYGTARNGTTSGIEIWQKGLHPEDRDEVIETCQAALRGEKAWNIEFRVQHPDGKILWIQADGLVLRNAQNEPIRMIGINRDITELKRAEENRLELEAQLQQVHKLESIGFLAGGIAHEFNNLLAGLFGYIDLAREDAKDGAIDKIIPGLTMALGAMDRAKSLTAQLLTFSKGGAPAKKTVEISNLIKNVTIFALSDSLVKPDFQISDDLWPVDIDGNQLAQAIDNIVRNARDAVKSGTVTIKANNCSNEVSLPKVLTPGRYLQISIADQGSGISEENLRHIFDPFFTTKEKGRGLGLSIAYSIIKKHNGFLTVESKLGKGTVFHIYLPVTHETASLPKMSAPEQRSLARKVLVMDDEAAILEVAGRMLERIGYSVICAAHGEETIRLYKEAYQSIQPFDAVILDLSIRGGLGGVETMQELRRIDPNIVGIVCSGYADDPAMANPLAYGFKEAIAKPYRAAELQKVLGKILS